MAKGNEAVDHVAKAGTEMDVYYGKQQALSEQRAKSRWAVQNVGRGHQNVDGDWPDVPEKQPGQPRRREEPKPQLSLTKHQVGQRGKWQVSAKCGKRGATARTRRKL